MKAAIESVRDFEPKIQFRLVPFENIKVGTARNYLVKGLIPREGLVVIWGPPKCGKTFVTFDLVLHVALGWGYRGRQVDGGPVVYVACEGERGLAARAEAFRRAKMSEATANVPFFLLTTRLDLVSDADELIGDIARQIEGGACSAIVIDTLNRSIRGSESDDADMGAYVKAADKIRETFRCAVIIVHHCGVEGSRPRGHTSLTGAADAQISVKRDANRRIITEVEWMKDGPEGARTVSELDVVEVGIDEDGEPITSCVVKQCDDAVAAERHGRKLAGAAKVAHDLLKKAIDDAGEPAPANNHIPPGARVVGVDLWRRYVREGSVADSDKPDTQRKAFARAVEKLQSLALVGVWNELAWLTEPKP